MSSTLPLYDKTTGAVVGHLTEPVPVEQLQHGDRVWDEINDEEAVYDGWYHGSHVLDWASEYPLGGFCAGPGSRWRRVVIYPDEPEDLRPKP